MGALLRLDIQPRLDAQLPAGQLRMDGLLLQAGPHPRAAQHRRDDRPRLVTRPPQAARRLLDAQHLPDGHLLLIARPQDGHLPPTARLQRTARSRLDDRLRLAGQLLATAPLPLAAQPRRDGRLRPVIRPPLTARRQRDGLHPRTIPRRLTAAPGWPIAAAHPATDRRRATAVGLVAGEDLQWRAVADRLLATPVADMPPAVTATDGKSILPDNPHRAISA